METEIKGYIEYHPFPRAITLGDIRVVLTSALTDTLLYDRKLYFWDKENPHNKKTISEQIKADADANACKGKDTFIWDTMNPEPESNTNRLFAGQFYIIGNAPKEYWLDNIDPKKLFNINKTKEDER